LGHAYQVLSNEQSRANYDKNGPQEDGKDNDMASEVDPFVFFNVMFGSALVEPYVGELWIAQTTAEAMSDTDTMEEFKKLELDGKKDGESEEERREKLMEKMREMKEKNELTQKKRQAKIANNLKKRLSSYTPSTKADFIIEARKEAEKIAAGAYGSLYCITIGYQLLLQAEEFIGDQTSFLGLGGLAARTKSSTSALGTNFKLIGAAFSARAMQEAENLQRKAMEKGAAAEGAKKEDGKEDDTYGEKEGAEIDAEDEKKLSDTFDASLPAFLNFTWAINKRDIQQTLQAACPKVFRDASVNDNPNSVMSVKATQLQRAEAMEILGREFFTVGKLHEKLAQDGFNAEDIKARVAVATMTTMAKAQGQEVTEADQEEMIKQAKLMGKNPEAQAAESEGEKADEANTDSAAAS
jgi:X-domain of DnaJ-containing